MKEAGNINFPIFDNTTSPTIDGMSGCTGDIYAGFKLCWTVDITSQKAYITFYWDGIQIGGTWVIDPSSNCIHLGGSFRGFDINLNVCADWAEKDIYIDGAISTPFSHNDFHNQVILTW